MRELIEAVQDVLNYWDQDLRIGYGVLEAKMLHLRQMLDAEPLQQIAEALRQHGLTLVKTASGYAVMKFGPVVAQQAEPVRCGVCNASDAGKAVWLGDCLRGPGDCPMKVTCGGAA